MGYLDERRDEERQLGVIEERRKLSAMALRFGAHAATDCDPHRFDVVPPEDRRELVKRTIGDAAKAVATVLANGIVDACGVSIRSDGQLFINLIPRRAAKSPRQSRRIEYGDSAFDWDQAMRYLKAHADLLEAGWTAWFEVDTDRQRWAFSFYDAGEVRA